MTSPTVTLHSVEPHHDATLEVMMDDSADSDTDSDADSDIDSDHPEETQFDNVLLDDSPEDVSEDDSSEDEGQDSKAVAAMVGMDVDDMEVDEEILVPASQHEGSERPLPFQAGCVWMKSDWSCAYDAAFMAFFTIYWQSSPGWRSDWRQQTPEWTAQLADRFDSLLTAFNSGKLSREDLSTLFSYHRDQFRDQLTHFSRERFPRRGRAEISVCAILEVLFGSVLGPRVDRHLSCTHCGAVSQSSHDFPLLGLSQQGYRRETDPRFIPSQTLLTRFIEALPSGLSLCNSCHGVLEVRSLTMETSPWIWFETRRETPMAPSPTILIELPGQRLTYDLHSIIYLGGNHFTARMRDPSGDWWNYDGMQRFGAPRRDPVQHPTDLLWNGRRYATFFIYRSSEH